LRFEDEGEDAEADAVPEGAVPDGEDAPVIVVPNAGVDTCETPMAELTLGE
jgi:hypothetical protein